MNAEKIAEVLAAHALDFTYDGKWTGCSCGHWQERGPVSADADHAAHQAEALEPVIQEREKAAFDRAWTIAFGRSYTGRHPYDTKEES